MVSFLLRRLLASALTLLAIVLLSFLLMRVVPGGPFDQERAMSPEVRQALETKYGLRDPLPVQCLRYVVGLLKGDLGPSLSQPDRSVNTILAEGLPRSAILGATALFIALLVGGLAGVYAALHHNEAADYVAMGLVMLGVSIPSMVLAPLLVTLFALTLHWLPTSGWGTLGHLVLPATALGLAYAARIARLTRGGMLEVLRQDFIRTARAKGLSEAAIVRRHALRLGLGPLVSYLGPATASILTGSFVIEQIFDIPGMGRHFVNAATSRDYTLALGTVIVYSTFLIALNLVVDLAHALLDPRIRLE
ncbi:MAG TPA: ABC transporter permease subunit [Planctomycetota bacterium]|nr:ABC transporter permease subunit [Planctomycetota bacterium]